MKRIWIDGYNLLHASNIFPAESRTPSFERTRQAFCDWLAGLLEERVRRGVTVFFDGAEAPRGAPAEVIMAGLAVCFSRLGQTADEQIALRLADDRQPKQLTVVSSDHGVQREARRVGAQYIDSHEWLKVVRASAALRPGDSAERTEPEKPAGGNLADFEPHIRDAAEQLHRSAAHFPQTTKKLAKNRNRRRPPD